MLAHLLPTYNADCVTASARPPVADDTHERSGVRDPEHRGRPCGHVAEGLVAVIGEGGAR